MPQEVFTISGSSFGAHPVDVQALIARGSAAAQQLDAKLRSFAPGGSPAARLQAALKALGNTVGDATLKAIKVDGVIGPATARAVNLAIASYVGATAEFPNANFTVATAKRQASALAQLITTAVVRNGGTVAAVRVKHAGGGGGGAVNFDPNAIVPDQPDRRWIWWVVGGVGSLLALSVVVGMLKRRREAEPEPKRKRK